LIVPLPCVCFGLWRAWLKNISQELNRSKNSGARFRVIPFYQGMKEPGGLDLAAMIFSTGENVRSGCHAFFRMAVRD